MGFVGDILGFNDNSGAINANTASQKKLAEQQMATSKLQNEMSQDYWNQSAGARNSVLNQLANFMGGNYNLSELPMYGPGKSAIESQYQNAFDNILANLPAGGQIGNAMADLERNRAADYGQLVGNIQSDLLNKAYGVANQSPITTFGGLQGSQYGLQGAGNTYTGIGNTLAQQQAAQNSLLGDLGMGFAMLI